MRDIESFSQQKMRALGSFFFSFLIGKKNSLKGAAKRVTQGIQQVIQIYTPIKRRRNQERGYSKKKTNLKDNPTSQQKELERKDKHL